MQGGTRTLTISDGLSGSVMLSLRIGAGLDMITHHTVSNCTNASVTSGSGDIVFATSRNARGSVGEMTDTNSTVYRLVLASQPDTNSTTVIHMWAGQQPSSHTLTISVGRRTRGS